MFSYAGFWKRFAAGSIDEIVIYIPLSVMLYFLELDLAQDGLSYDDMEIVEIIVNIFIWWLYNAVMDSSPTQGTLGKMALGIKITDLNGERISFGRATGNHFAQYLSIFTYGIGYLMIAWTKRKQALHDKISGCIVIEKNNQTI